MSQSYIYLTYSTGSYSYTSNTTTQLTSSLTTGSISSDWTNDGSGKFTYNGSSSRVFYFYGRVNQTSSTNNFNCQLTVWRNNKTQIFDVGGGTNEGLVYYNTSVSVDVEGTQGPIVINPNDYFYIYIRQNDLNTGTSSNFNINFAITSN